MIKDISEQIKEIGLTPLIGGLLILASFILIGDISNISSLFNFKELDSKKILAIIFLIIGFILIYNELTKIKRQIAINIDVDGLTDTDKEILKKIAKSFERKAYMDAEEDDEDLRAIFSAANETRIKMYKLKNEIRFPILRKLVESMYKDFEEIRKLTPLFLESEIKPFDPDEVGVRPNRERTFKDMNYINEIWSKTQGWEDYITKHKEIADSGYYPYTAIMIAVKKKMKLLSDMKKFIIRII